jgi:plasmid stabilization system protein ParE
MAGRVIWSLNAERHLQDILEYWKNRNKSSVYPKKLKRMFLEMAKTLSAQPYLGKLIKAPHVLPEKSERLFDDLSIKE